MKKNNQRLSIPVTVGINSQKSEKHDALSLHERSIIMDHPIHRIKDRTIPKDQQKDLQQWLKTSRGHLPQIDLTLLPTMAGSCENNTLRESEIAAVLESKIMETISEKIERTQAPKLTRRGKKTNKDVQRSWCQVVNIDDFSERPLQSVLARQIYENSVMFVNLVLSMVDYLMLIWKRKIFGGVCTRQPKRD